MTLRNLEWLQSELALMLSFTHGSPDQTFAGPAEDPWKVLRSALNEAADQELEEAATNCGADCFMTHGSFVWPVSQIQYTLQPPFAGATIVEMDDVTDGGSGELLLIQDRTVIYEPSIWPAGQDTFQWGQTGPGSARTIRVWFLPTGGQLHTLIDEPRWLPGQFRHLLVYSAAVIAYSRIFREVPIVWLRKQVEWRQLLHSAFQRGNPVMTNPPAVRASMYTE